MNSQIVSVTPATVNIDAAVLTALRLRYQEGHDLFNEGELARLRFFRWLYQTGRLQP
jgi:hypothetical protein